MPALRPALPQDAAALAALHVTVWRETYGALAPSAAYDALTQERRLAQWQQTLSEPPPVRTLIAGEAKGLIGLGPATQPIFATAGEIRHLYVARDCRGTGLGARLLRAGLQALAADGFTRAGLAVVAANTAARAFYAAQGGTEGPGFLDQGPLWRSENLVIWFDLSHLGRAV